MEMVLRSRIQTLKEIRSEIPTGFVIVSFLLFWLRAINFNIIQFTLALLYVGLLINIPLFLAWLLFSKNAGSEIGWRVILFQVMALTLSKLGVWLDKFYFKVGIITRYYQLGLLYYNVEVSGSYLEIRGIWFY